MILPHYKIGQPQAVALNSGNSEDGRAITRGVRQKGDCVTVTVNFTGLFVFTGTGSLPVQGRIMADRPSPFFRVAYHPFGGGASWMVRVYCPPFRRNNSCPMYW